MYVSLPDGKYHDTAEAAARAMTSPWGWATLAQAIARLQVGDELDVDDERSIVRLSGVNHDAPA